MCIRDRVKVPFKWKNGNWSRTRLQPVIRVAPPNAAAHSCSNNHQRLPDPQRQEHDPEVPLYDAIQTQGKQQWKHQQAAVHYKFATTTQCQTSVKISINQSILGNPINSGPKFLYLTLNLTLTLLTLLLSTVFNMVQEFGTAVYRIAQFYLSKCKKTNTGLDTKGGCNLR